MGRQDVDHGHGELGRVFRVGAGHADVARPCLQDHVVGGASRIVRIATDVALDKLRVQRT